jgi:hypothetical protein
MGSMHEVNNDMEWNKPCICICMCMLRDAYYFQEGIARTNSDASIPPERKALTENVSGFANKSTNGISVPSPNAQAPVTTSDDSTPLGAVGTTESTLTDNSTPEDATAKPQATAR